MKQIFFFAILIVLPVAVLGGGLIYLVWHTVYTFYDDWQLSRELDEIRAASRAKRAETGAAPRPSDTNQAESGADDDIPSSTVASGDPPDSAIDA